MADKSAGQHSGHAFEGICLKFIEELLYQAWSI